MKFLGMYAPQLRGTRLLLLSILCLSASSAQASLIGNYTIDASGSASSTNYKTFASAVSDLVSGSRADGGAANGSGVSGAVVFKVANGTYNEQISIGSITGVSASNTVTFQSAGGDSSKVILTFASSTSSTNNYTLQLNAADYIIFKKITIERSGTSTYGRVLDISGGSDKNQFLHNRVTSGYSTSTGNTRALIFSSSGADSANVFEGNLLKYGSYCFYFIAGSTTRETGNIIRGNVTDSAYYDTYRFGYQDYFVLDGNAVTNTGWGGSSYILYLTDLGKATITRNKVYTPSTSATYGVYLGTSAAPSGDRGLIANNMISGPLSGAGIYLPSAQNYDVVYNTVVITSTSTSARGLYISGSSSYQGDYVVNNNFINTGAGLAIEVATGAVTYNTFDSAYNNNYYAATSATLIKWNGNSYSTLSAYQTAAKQDVNSINKLPATKSTSDLHLNGIDPGIDGKGAPFSSVTTDFDNETRNATTPDIGADEVTPFSRDAQVSSVISPLTGLCAGKYALSVKVSNLGTDNLDTVTLTYVLNGTQQSQKKFTLNALKFTKDTILTIDSVTLSNSASNIIVYVSKPNGSTDLNASNDTLTVTLQSALKGTYTIGSGKDYSGFSSAVSAMITRGLCGAVTFKVDDGTYTEQISIPQISGASATNTITFQSASGDSSKAILQFASSTSSTNNYLVQLNGTDFVTFRKLTLQRTGTSSNALVIEVKGGAHWNTFTNNKIWGVLTSSSTSSSMSLITSTSDKDTNNTFSNNYLKYGSVPIIWTASSSTYETNNAFTGNIIDSGYEDVTRISYQDNFTFRGNTVFGMRSTGSWGVRIENGRNGGSISKNIITNGTGTYGMYLVTNSGTSTSPLVVNNNMVMFPSTSSTGSGILDNANTNALFYYNTVLVTGTGSSARAFYVDASSSSPRGYQRINNNIFMNTGGGVAVEISTNAVNTKQVDTSDNNDLYVTGATLGKAAGTSYANISAWRTGTNQDPQSLAVNPKFKSNTNLHISYVLLDGAAIPVTQVKDDIDGETRNTTTPDIGADEFTPPPTDAGVASLDYPTNALCAGTYDLKARIKNYGGSQIDSVTIVIMVDGVQQSSTKYRFTLGIDKDTSLKIGTITLGSMAQTLKIYTTKPNDIADGGKSNDTLVAKVQAGMTGTYTIGSGKDYANFTAAVKDLVTRGLCGAVDFKADNGTYTEQISIPEIAGASTTNTITFESASGDSSKVILSFASASSGTENYTLQLNGADNVIFKKLTIQRTGASSNGAVVEVKGGANGNTITNSRLIGVAATSNATTQAVLISSSDKDTSNTFSNNLIKNGSVPVVWTASSTTYESGNTFTGNQIDNGYEDAVRISYQDKVTFSGNTVTGSTSTTSSGVRIENAKNGGTVANNRIVNPSGSYALYLSNNVGTSASPMMVYNNMVSLTSSSPVAAVYDNVNQYLYLYHNSVLVSGSSTSAKVLYVNSASTSPKGFQRLFNNVMTNTGGGLVAEITTDAATTEQVDTSDFNAVFTTGTNVVKLGTTNFTTFSSWQSYAGQDPSSIVANPRFYSNTDLHARGVSMDNKGYYLSDVPNDIDGQARSTSKPDIGADEYTAPKKDLSLVTILSPASGAASCGNASTKVIVVIRNEGSASQTGFDVKTTITGALSTTLSTTYGKTLGSLQNDTITYTSTLNTLGGGTINVLSYTALSGDEYMANDSAKQLAIDINPVPVAKFSASATTICPKEAVSFTDQSTIASGSISSYTWDFGDNTGSTSASPSKIYKAGGKYTVSLTVKSSKGCSHTSTTTITVNPEMKPAFTASSKICADVPLSMTNTSSIAGGNIASYDWDFGDGTGSTDSLPLKAYATPGKYSVRLITTSDAGCKDTAIQSLVEVVARPKTSFTFNNVCAQNATQFTNTSSATGGIVYSWTFGDGSVSGDKNPAHTYAKGGQYKVRLILTNNNGCQDSMTQTVTVNYKPQAGFSANRACLNDPVAFINNSTIDGDSISQHIWTFGDGGSSTDKNPVHTYAGAGNYTVGLIVLSDKGCSDTFTQKLVVYNVPQVGFTAGNVCSGNTMQFVNQFVSASFKYTWAFGDGDTSHDVSPAHTYKAAGAYSVTLLVANSNGCERSLTKTVTVFEKPVADFTAGDACLGSVIDFKDNSTMVNSTGASWNWSFGDNTFSTSQNPGHKYTAPGDYKVILMIVNGNGCKDTAEKTVTVHPLPNVGFEANKVCIGKATKFTNHTTISSGTIVKYVWQVGPLATDTISGENPEYTFTKPGAHTVTLTAYTDKGCVASASIPVTVYDLPKLTFTKKRTHRTVKMTVSDSSYQSYAWDFGDTTTISTEKNPSHFYPVNGTYTITLKVTNANGCDTTLSDTVKIEILGVPKANTPAAKVNVYPNPFSKSTTLDYELMKPAHVSVVLYDMQGREMSRLLDNAAQGAGKYTRTINATEMKMVSGSYILRLIIDDEVVTKQIIRVE